MRLLSSRLLAWLMATTCLCGGISSNEHPAFVLTQLKEGATNIQMPFTTDTEVACNSKPKVYDLTINGNVAAGSGYNINGNKIDITDLSKLETGQNVLNLYYQVQSVNITKFFHLYMFTPPEIDINSGTESNTRILSCSLSKTGATRYRNWIVEFTKLDDKNTSQSVGLCIENVSYSNPYYSESLEACILKLSYPIQQQDAGNYLCTLHIRHTEINFVTRLPSRPVEVKEMYLQYVIPSVIAGFLILLIVVGIVSAAVVYKRKYRPHVRHRYHPQERLPAQNGAQNTFQDTSLRPRSCPPATDYLLRHQHPSYGSNKELVGSVLQHELDRQFVSSSSTVSQGACLPSSPFTPSEGIQSDYSLSADDESTPKPTQKEKGNHNRKNSLVSAHQTWGRCGGAIGGEGEIVSGRTKIGYRKPATGVHSPSVPPQNSDDESENESKCTLTPSLTPGSDEHMQLHYPMSKNPSDKMLDPAVNAASCVDSTVPLNEDSSKQPQPTAPSSIEPPNSINTALSNSLTVDSAGTSNASPSPAEDDNSSKKPPVTADSSLERHKSINTATSGSSPTDSNASPSSAEDENSSKQHAAEAASLQSYSVDTAATRSSSSDMDSPRVCTLSTSTDGKNMPKPKPDSLAQKSVITDPRMSSTSQFSPTETECSIAGQNVERENNYFTVGSSRDKPSVDGETRNERQLENRERKKKKTTKKK